MGTDNATTVKGSVKRPFPTLKLDDERNLCKYHLEKARPSVVTL